MKKQEKGITLIALIITIVILMILAVVTIGAVKNDGIIQYALSASRKYKKAKLQEELNNIISAMNLDIYENPDEYTVTEEELNENEYAGEMLLLMTPLEKIEEYFEVYDSIIITGEIENVDGITETIRGFDLESMYSLGLVAMTVDDNDNITAMKLTVPCIYEETNVDIIVNFELINETTYKLTLFEIKIGKDVVNITSTTPVLTAGGNIKEITSDGVPIPKGFYYVTGTKNTGVVISDSADDENNLNGNNGNQFVWVPVNVNPELKVVLDELKDIKEVRILSTDGYDETITVNSDYFEKTIALSHNGVYEIIVTYADGTTKDILQEVNIVYDKEYTAYRDLENLLKYANASGGNYTMTSLLDYIKEYALENDPTLELNNKIDIINGGFVGSSQDDKVDNASETPNVLKYGGFYVGRYEVGGNNLIKRQCTPKTSITYADAKASAEALYNSEDYGVKSDLPSGTAWSAIGRWLISSGAKTEEQIYDDSTSWGNYKTTLIGHGTLRYTGYSFSYGANNIYDLAGNVQEWTKEYNSSNNEYFARGGSYEMSGSPSFTTSEDVSETTNYSGYRPILYLYE